MTKNSSIYWNPLLETMDREKLRNLQLKKFKRIFEWAYNNSPFIKNYIEMQGLNQVI